MPLRPTAPLFVALIFSVAACGSSPPPAPVVAPTPPPAPPPIATTPSATAAAPDTAKATPDKDKPADPNAGLAPFPAPSGFTWVQASGDYVLASEGPSGSDGSPPGACQVWQISTKSKVAALTGKDVAAGGADPTCSALSPTGHFVLYGNGRRSVWKNWKDQATTCSGVMAPDDSSCVDDDTTPFAFQEKNGAAANLDLYWSKPVPNGPHKKVATIPRGLNRSGPDDKWWTVQYCSPDKAVVDIKNGARITIDAKTGTSKSAKSDGSPLCP
ncbi:MAG TPA: hypothetical protein VF407_16475 [Polyangiaceae bacterium]